MRCLLASFAFCIVDDELTPILFVLPTIFLFRSGRLYQEWTCLHSGSHADSVKFPLPRIMHNLAIKGSAQNRMHDEVMVFGGMADGEVVNDMWIWMPSLTPF